MDNFQALQCFEKTFKENEEMKKKISELEFSLDEIRKENIKLKQVFKSVKEYIDKASSLVNDEEISTPDRNTKKRSFYQMKETIVGKASKEKKKFGDDEELNTMLHENQNDDTVKSQKKARLNDVSNIGKKVYTIRKVNGFPFIQAGFIKGDDGNFFTILTNDEYKKFHKGNV